MNEPGHDTDKPTRRQFIWRTAKGASLFGLGSALGLASSEQSAKALGFGSPKSGRTLGKEFSYDVSKFTRIDPSRIWYVESDNIATGLKTVRALATDSEDRIYVAGDQAVRVFSKSGEFIEEIPLGSASQALGVSNKRIYVAFEKHVEVFDEKGTRSAQWEKLPENSIITAVAAGEKDVFVADAGNRIVVRYDLGGKLLGRIGKRDPAKNVPGFVVPSPFFDLAIGSDGLLWVANPGRHRVEAYTFEGDFETSWGDAGNDLKGFCGCCNPIHFACLPDGRFVTSEKGLPRLKIYSAKGELECVVAGPEKFSTNPNLANQVCLDLAVDSAGRVLVADAQTKEVRIFTRKKP